MMSYLKQFSRNKRNKGKTEMLTARVPEKAYNEFKNHCEELGLSISEAVNLLINKELLSIEEELEEEEIQNNTNEIDNDHKLITFAINSNHHNSGNDKKSNIKKNIEESKVQSSSGRFTTTRWKVQEELPCPLCDMWVSSANFARHAKSHGTTTKEIFTTHSEKADGMVKERIEEKEGE
jgi:antitoxin component of RelBE/YafQ-DinJ toxin-antitoxin module